MTQTKALEALEQLVKEKKVSRQSLAYKTAKAAIENPDTPQPCGKKVGSGRFKTSTSWQGKTITILQRIGIMVTYKSVNSVDKVWYSTGNSAPQGGRYGDNIAVHFIDDFNA